MGDENKIKVERSTHNRQAIIKLLFGYDTELIARVKQLPNARWSQTMRCWYVPDTSQSVEALSGMGSGLDTKPASTILDKDRIVPLSDKILTLLRDYFKCYRPVTWLFEGQEPNTSYSEGSLQKVFTQAQQHHRDIHPCKHTEYSTNKNRLSMIWICKATYNKILPRGMPTSVYFKGSLTFMEATDKLGVIKSVLKTNR